MKLTHYLLRHILFPFTVLRVIWLRRRFKHLSIKWEIEQSNQHLAILKLLQAKIYYLNSQFDAWGYYHPSCTTTERHDAFMAWLFPPKDFETGDIITCYNPAAVTYYLNKIYDTGENSAIPYQHYKITEQLKEWGDNY